MKSGSPEGTGTCSQALRSTAGPRKQDLTEVVLIIPRAFKEIGGEILKAYLANLRFPNIPWKCIPEFQADEKLCQRKNENAKILSSVLPSMSTGNMVTKNLLG